MRRPAQSRQPPAPRPAAAPRSERAAAKDWAPADPDPAGACRYTIRLHAIEEYGLVIHEFDPWFNYRATEYLAQHGMDKFFKCVPISTRLRACG